MKKTLLSFFCLSLVFSIGQQVSAQPVPGGTAPVITEIMYNPPEAGNDTLEFLEILNPSLTGPVNMTGFYFSSGVQFTFPDGFVLGSGEYVLISSDSVIFETWYGLEAFQWTGGTALDNNGEGLTLRSGGGSVIDTVFFDDTNAWADADGTGFSLVLCDPSSDNNLPESWTLSENATGLTVNSLPIFADPGQASTCTPTGISDDNAVTALIYPNPTDGSFKVQFEPLEEAATLRIHNSLGQLVHTESLVAGTTSVEMNASLKSGYYLLSIDRGKTVERLKLTVR